MINKDRLVNEFLELVSIDSLTKNERMMADALARKLKDMGYEVVEDNAGEKIGSNTGNLISTVKGSKNVPAVMITAHMDTVEPGKGKKAVIENDVIKTDGTTILGSDDGAGIVCILECLKVLKENNIPHGDIQVVFSVAEEGGLLGAKNLDLSKIYAKYAFVLDTGGAIGTVNVKAPSQNIIYVTVEGKATHAGVEPEKGVSAIQIAADAIASMKLGRIDHETTANIGIINGGRETNIVCDRVDIKAEARSRDKKKLDDQTNHMKECFEKAAEKFGGRVDFKAVNEYPSFNIPENAPIINILKKAAEAAKVPLLLEETGGGSDTNIYNGKGIEAVNVSVGMNKVHSVDENIVIEDMVKAAEYLLAIISNIE